MYMYDIYYCYIMIIRIINFYLIDFQMQTTICFLFLSPALVSKNGHVTNFVCLRFAKWKISSFVFYVKNLNTLKLTRLLSLHICFLNYLHFASFFCFLETVGFIWGFFSVKWSFAEEPIQRNQLSSKFFFIIKAYCTYY